MTVLTNRDAELAALLGHKPTESTWKPTLFLIAQFREESERAAVKDMQEKAPEPATHKLDDSVIWTLLAAARSTSRPVINAVEDADVMLKMYKRRFTDDP